MGSQPPEKIEKGSAPPQPSDNSPRPKDKWDILDIILKPVGGLVTALVIGLLGYYTQGYLQSLDRIAESRAEDERRMRLYTELLNQREQSESKLRSEMFSKIIDSFITKNPNTTLDEQVLDLELLVHNFHESLNLTPLFAYLNRKLLAKNKDLTAKARESLKNRLKELAKEVAFRQTLALAPHGDAIEFPFIFSALKRDGKISNIIVGHMTTDREEVRPTPLIGDGSLKLAKHEQHFRLFLQDVDMDRKRLKVNLNIGGENDNEQLDFWVDYFDFPMIDNTRIKGGNRIAVVLSEFNVESSLTKKNEELLEGAGLITVIGFPEAYASMKDRAFLQDLLERLIEQNTSSGPDNTVGQDTLTNQEPSK